MTPPRLDVLPGARSRKVAVLLNARARSVRPRVVEALREVVPQGDLYVSASLDDARRIAAEVVRRDYDVILTGGGDGTFMGFLAAVRSELEADTSSDGSTVRALDRRPLPRFGILRLGTGNALAMLTGASGPHQGGVLRDIVDARTGRADRVRRLDLVEVEGLQAPFAGVGYDALILDNYNRWRERLSETALKRLGEGLAGYGLSVAFLSIPEAMRRFRHPEVEVVNRGGPAWPIDLLGRPTGEPVGPGEVLYRGHAVLVGAATCPHFGYGLRVFPAAAVRPGHFQLRIASTPIREALAHLPSIWRGEYASPNLHDFHAQRVEVRSAQPMPLQVGGDGAGWRDKVELAVADEPVEVLDYGALRAGSV